jgi:hypothetical protein
MVTLPRLGGMSMREGADRGKNFFKKLNAGDGRANAAKTGKEEWPYDKQKMTKLNQHCSQSWPNHLMF